MGMGIRMMTGMNLSISMRSTTGTHMAIISSFSTRVCVRRDVHVVLVMRMRNAVGMGMGEDECDYEPEYK